MRNPDKHLTNMKKMSVHPKENKLEHPCFPQPKDGTTKVWRYLDLAKFIWLLENKKLYLTNIAFLNDPHEGSKPKALANQELQELQLMLLKPLVEKYGGNSDNKEFLEEVSKIPSIADRLRLAQQQVRQWMYVNCWHLGNSESEAMWRLYCPGDKGVAIQTNYNKLVESIADISSIYIGQVTYIDYESQVFPSGNMLYPVMHKRISFTHEQEVRLVSSKGPENWGTPQEVLSDGLEFNWPIESTIEAIYVNPYAPEYFYESVKAVVRSIAPNLESKVLWSQMRASPIF